jgi:hypothetical protein
LHDTPGDSAWLLKTQIAKPARRRRRRILVISTTTKSVRDKLKQATAAKPSPRQIQARMAEIRQTWSPGERALRARHHQLRLQRLAAALMASGFAPLTSAE